MEMQEMMGLYDKTTFGCSKLITKHYSTSFTLGIRTLHEELHESIYGIYGFVRYTDEIVDTFHEYDKANLLSDFKKQTYEAIEKGISLNPVLHSYQKVVNKFGIENELTEAFFKSMEMDLEESVHDKATYDEYIYGSAEVVGLMCLRVFVDGDQAMFDRLRAGAQKLGAAFQKVNFLRDMQSDFADRGRVYFPELDFSEFGEHCKCAIEDDIEADFAEAFDAIQQLPESSRLGVYLAYRYYRALLNKIKKVSPMTLREKRISVANPNKMVILAKAYLRNMANVL